MNRFVLVLFIVLRCGIGYISASDANFATVAISYTYYNDPASRAVGLVPMRLHSSEQDPSRVYTITLNIHFYGKTRTVEEILDIVIDKFDLNDFVRLHLWAGTEKVDDDHTFTMEELCRIGRLAIDYRINENTLDRIKARRINWIIDQIAGPHTDAWGNRAQWERIRAIVEKNLVDESGGLRSLRELRDLVLQ